MQSVARFFGIVAICLLATGACADTAEAIGASSESPKMLLRIHETGSLADIDPDALKAISELVSDALVKAGYDVTDAATLDGNQEIRTSGKPMTNEVLGEFSHALEVVVDPVQKKQTPVGLSLSLGDPDPRSLDFQKATVAPIRCTRIRLKGFREQGTLVQDRQAPGRADPSLQWGEAEQRTYARHIFSVCRSLLADLDMPRTLANAEGSTTEPRVRVETTYVEEQPTSPAAPAFNGPAASCATVPRKTRRAKPAEQATKMGAAETSRMQRESPAAHSAQPEREPEKKRGIFSALKTQRSDRRKQITIFNPGDTLILEFGNNRR